MKAPEPMYMSFSMDKDECIATLNETVMNKLKKAGITNVSFSIETTDEFMTLDFAITGGNESETQGKIKALGFDSNTFFNVDKAIEMAFGDDYSYELNYQQDTVIFSVHAESKHILSSIQNIFNNIDNMTADEAKVALSNLHRDFKERYGWQEVKL